MGGHGILDKEKTIEILCRDPPWAGEIVFCVAAH